jgi:hypothetical protein
MMAITLLSSQLYENVTNFQYERQVFPLGSLVLYCSRMEVIAEVGSFFNQLPVARECTYDSIIQLKFQRSHPRFHGTKAPTRWDPLETQRESDFVSRSSGLR